MFYSSRMTNASHQCLCRHDCYFPQEPNEILQCKYSTFSRVSELLFQVCIQTHNESSQDSLWGRTAEGTGHCKYRVCSPLWIWGKQQPGSSRNSVPCWGLCISTPAVGKWVGKVWEEWVWSRRFTTFYCKELSHQDKPASNAKMSSAKQGCNSSSSAAARAAVQPAHQGHASCSCRNLPRALAWRTPSPMLHTDKVLLFFHRKRSGARKFTCGGNPPHPLPWQ